ncbi:MAG TPA: TPM domain-containing protein [Rubricoccaceae bacterium]|nr:TPM domain-containing protein [Rubricoccaceae bacterium]
MRALPILALLLAAPAAAQGVLDLPLTGRVMDGAGVLAEATEASLTTLLEAHEAATTNQVVVLTVPGLEGYPVEDVANQLYNRWGLGQSDRDNGVLLLVARDDRELRIEVGYGLEGALTDAEAGRIIRNVIVPRFRDGDFDGGVSAGVSAILGTIEGTYEPPEDAGDEGPWWLSLIFLFTHGVLPLLLVARGLVSPPVERYFTFLFCSFFVGVAFGMIPGLVLGEQGLVVGVVLFALYVVAFFALDIYMTLSPKWKAIRKRVRAAKKSGKKTKIDAGWISFSAGGSSSSGGGGGGFSGGGGSSGGGGASGSW